MNHPRYRAVIYLKQPVTSGDGVECVASLYTKDNLEKNQVLGYVKCLYSQGIIQAYQMLYSPKGDVNDWYYDVEHELGDMKNNHHPVLS